MSEIKEDILAALAYFDLFKYPLNSSEIYLFLKNRYKHNDFDDAIKCLLDTRQIFQFGKLYSLKNEPQLAVRRFNGNKKAAELIQIAHKVGDMLIRFPYVRGVAISGSLSKNFADDDSDIDLFIITAKNRLWVARTMMHAFKKLTFLFNKQDYFCMNYYVDEQQLEIVEKTIYTAIEVVTLIPLQGDTVFERFYKANAWTRQYLPNKIMRVSSAKPTKKTFLKIIFETIFNNGLGNSIDDLLMNITADRWLKKTELKKLNAKGKVLALDVNKHYAKPDPRNFQEKILTQYELKVTGIIHEQQSSLAN
jgi:predicted nucleotidyltransferase